LHIENINYIRENHNRTVENPKYFILRYSYTSQMPLDILDLKIVSTLTDDARCTYKKIAEEAGVSEATVKNRMDKLQEQGIIKKFTVIMDYHKLGRAIKAFIGLKVQPAKLSEIVEVIEVNPDVHVLYRTSGDVDLLIEVIFEQMEDLNKFLETELALEGILGTVVTIVIGPYKRCPWTGL
jgi:DNA-binding Lrp family transcriptional regulator